MDYLLFMTVGPVIAIFVLYALFAIKVIHLRRGIKASGNKEVEKSVTHLRNKAFFYVLFVSYLILPGVSTAIFRVFSCINVDPDSVSDGFNYYMQADRSISCSSSRYHFGFAWAVAMIFIYPIGR